MKTSRNTDEKKEAILTTDIPLQIHLAVHSKRRAKKMALLGHFAIQMNAFRNF